MNYDNTIICDYVTLWFKDADNHPDSDFSDGRAVWDIPPNAYYYKDRGSVCMMSIVDATLNKNIGDNVVLMTQSGFNSSTAQIYGDVNQFDNDTQDLGVLGHFVVNRAEGSPAVYETKYLSPEVIKVLTPARPRTIKLFFVDEDKALHNLNNDGGDDNGHITIKFEYVKPEILQKNIYSVENKPAF